ncbi:uncharacterized protein C16orf78 homolog isoform X2 [Heterocephalus glaber]|uniref:Uncharacterized protein C16orf78 homolog isoform X2 n=1 Tax=Heterocephalus glaber TaxID=10181 RepID=A0AAX6T951_HETGA|nr:uncharacterized protein C16orf78 homolog isoform X2 [Heterocephalus glaber]
MAEKPEDPKEPKDLKDLMPTERKTVWRTAEERKMSDLTRVLEWLQRRKGKKKQFVQKQKVMVMDTPKAKMKGGKKVKGIWKQQERVTKSKFQEQTPGPSSRRLIGSITLYQRPFGGEQRHLSIFAGTYDKDGSRRSDFFFPGYISLQEILNFKNGIRVRQARHLRHKIKGGTHTQVLALYLHKLKSESLLKFSFTLPVYLQADPSLVSSLPSSFFPLPSPPSCISHPTHSH